MQNYITAAPTPGHYSPQEPVITREPGPILFVNPSVLLDEAPTIIRAGAIQSAANGYGQVGPVGGTAALTSGPDEFNRLCESVKPSLVFTCQPTQFHPASQLLNRGFRCRLAVDMALDPRVNDRAAAITLWLDQHGRPPAIVLERPGVVPQDTLCATFAVGSLLNREAVDRILAAWTARAK